DGYSVLEALKSDPKTRLIPVVMLTTHDQITDKVKAVEIGADDYLPKPFNLVELKARVKSLLSLKRFTDELEHASEVLEAIAACVENRDRYTGNHCRRLADYAVALGKDLGLAEPELLILKLGGALHDLGKVAVSDNILNKPGRLSPEELGIMRTHPAIGADLCGKMRTMEKVLPMIRHHHERLDGSGYPDGIGGHELSLSVRVISVVDVFDALYTKRSYKDSLPLEKCLDILREESQKGWWDRDVVEALARRLRKGVTIEGEEIRLPSLWRIGAW
ncbi:MAG TPA: HD domain-containing phosphohydrolase, partial [Planctomycetota bacterium]|nr:HD domain-containing phosphohydrolase [Planctomycetota bacterium]